jgi:hypothetical protein
MAKREYRVAGRYEYWAVDVYIDNGMHGTVDTFRTRKQAQIVANALNAAYSYGMQDGATSTMKALNEYISESKIVPDHSDLRSEWSCATKPIRRIK